MRVIHTQITRIRSSITMLSTPSAPQTQTLPRLSRDARAHAIRRAVTLAARGKLEDAQNAWQHALPLARPLRFP
ncbi:MAG: hypothetical protein M3418_13540 [Gemmatimonadota bacterium]|jgi:hypothetical protein|nr:hypothetical protein [Gemmatimonadota bacterium]